MSGVWQTKDKIPNSELKEVDFVFNLHVRIKPVVIEIKQPNLLESVHSPDIFCKIIAIESFR